ncbi:MAG TPA: hypothetical protein VEA44_16735 [Caulobacter sp.]|nr:hypothetical protein [Caulobacter sp.]
MPAYRFYDLTPPEPEAMSQGVFFSDAAAMTWGFRRAGPGGIEVWQGDRFVGRLHGADSLAAGEGLDP